MKTLTTIPAAALLALASGALAQSTNIDDVNKLAWGENIGWLNWADAGAPAGSQGAVVGDLIMSGFVWSENVGWVDLGDGSPANGLRYANTGSADFGVNIAPSGRLYGLAWGENIGWVNFDTFDALHTSTQHARLDRNAGRLRGYAWGENIGWINLDDAQHFVGVSPPCPCDWNRVDGLDSQDFFDFLDDFFAGDADFNGADGTDSQDYFDFLECFFTGCP